MTTATTEAFTPEAQSAWLSRPTTQLKLAALVTADVGLLIALGAHDRTDGILRWFLDLVFLPLGDPATLTDESQVLAGVLGGVLVGWAVATWLLVDSLGAEHPAALKRIVLVSMAIWFVVDSAASIASGGWLNAVFNIGFLAMFVVPALRLR